MAFLDADIRAKVVARTMCAHIVGHLSITHVKEILTVPRMILMIRVHNLRIGGRNRRIIRFTLMFEFDLVFIQRVGLPVLHHRKLLLSSLGDIDTSLTIRETNPQGMADTIINVRVQSDSAIYYTPRCCYQIILNIISSYSHNIFSRPGILLHSDG